MASEISSQTQDSVSLPPSHHVSLRPQDKGKFVSRWDVEPCSVDELTKRVDKVAEALAEQAKVQGPIEQAIMMRTAKVEEFALFSEQLAKIEEVHDKQEKKLHGISGIDKVLATVSDKAAMSQLVERVQQLEADLFVSSKNRRMLQALCEAGHFIDAYKQVKESVPALYAVITDQSEEKIEAFITTVDAIIKQYYPDANELYQGKPTKQKIDNFIKSVQDAPQEKAPSKQEALKRYARRELSQEMLQVAKVIAQALFAEKKNAPTKTTQRLSWRIRLLEAFIIHAQARLQKKSLAELQFDTHVSEAMMQFGHQEQHQGRVQELLHVNDIITFKQDDAMECSFWKNPAWSWAGKWYSGGWYRQTGALATAMEEDVAKVLVGLVRHFTRRVNDFFRGDIEHLVGYESLQHEFEYYQRCLKTVEATFTRYFEQLCRTPFDDLTQPVIDYASGIRHTFSKAEDLIRLAAKCVQGPAKAIFGAKKAVTHHFGASAFATDLERTLKLHAVIVKMKEAELKKPAQAKKPFAALLTRTLELVNELHAKKDAECLQLAPDEKMVPFKLLGGDSLDSFYHNFEAGGLLPVVVMNYLVKEMLHYLYLPSDVQGVAVQVMLTAIEQNKKTYALYNESVREHQEFASLVREFKAHSKWLDAKDLQSAVSIGYYVSRESLLDYAKALQLYVEFVRSKPNIFESLLHLLHGWFSRSNHPKIPPEVLMRDIESWKINKNKPEEFLAELKDPTHFSAILLRIVSASCFAKEVEEQVLGQTLFKLLFCSDSYTELMEQAKGELIPLVHESMLQRVLYATAEVEEKWVVEHLIEGPLQEIGTSEQVELVRFKLLQQEPEDGPIKSHFIAQKGVPEFQRWQSGFIQFVANNPVAQLAKGNQ